jgi:hypothetical protein
MYNVTSKLNVILKIKGGCLKIKDLNGIDYCLILSPLGFVLTKIISGNWIISIAGFIAFFLISVAIHDLIRWMRKSKNKNPA